MAGSGFEPIRKNGVTRSSVGDLRYFGKELVAKTPCCFWCGSPLLVKSGGYQDFNTNHIGSGAWELAFWVLRVKIPFGSRRVKLEP